MKTNFFSFLLVIFGTSFGHIGAQSTTAPNLSPDQDLARLKSTYRLDEKQTEKVKTLLVRRERQMVEIQSIKDPKKFRQKRMSVQRGAQSGFTHILYPAQYEVYKTEQIRLRKARGLRYEELKKLGNSNASIQDQTNEFEF